ncbi:MAG: hypothetical protein M3O22_05430 [Pseudomonadota bacterium]|nr:hypothetical protein [Pseudomonadota bacterium]
MSVKNLLVMATAALVSVGTARAQDPVGEETTGERLSFLYPVVFPTGLAGLRLRADAGVPGTAGAQAELLFHRDFGGSVDVSFFRAHGSDGIHVREILLKMGFFNGVVNFVPGVVTRISPEAINTRMERGALQPEPFAILGDDQVLPDSSPITSASRRMSGFSLSSPSLGFNLGIDLGALTLTTHVGFATTNGYTYLEKDYYTSPQVNALAVLGFRQKSRTGTEGMSLTGIAGYLPFGKEVVGGEASAAALLSGTMLSGGMAVNSVWQSNPGYYSSPRQLRNNVYFDTRAGVSRPLGKGFEAGVDLKASGLLAERRIIPPAPPGPVPASVGGGESYGRPVTYTRKGTVYRIAVHGSYRLTEDCMAGLSISYLDLAADGRRLDAMSALSCAFEQKPRPSPESVSP